MNAEQRNQTLARIREERLARNGRPVVDRTMVIRCVIASQELAGIDARAFFGLNDDWKPGDPIPEGI